MNRIIIVTGILLCAVLAVFYMKSVSTTGDLKTHTSPLFNITFDYPDAYVLTEEYNDIILTYGDKKITMSLAGSAGQTTDADSYLDLLVKQNKLVIQKKLPIRADIFSGYNLTVYGQRGNLEPFNVLSDNSGSIYSVTSHQPELADDIAVITGSFRRSAD